MAQPEYVRRQGDTFTNIFPTLDCNEITVGTLNYTTLNPPPTGTTRWAVGVNPNSIYNINSGNVGIGTNNPPEKLSVVGNLLLTGGIDCSAPIQCASDITCSQLNYTTLNPPIAGSSKWSDDSAGGGIYRQSTVGIGTFGAPNPYSLWVDGDARIEYDIEAPGGISQLSQINLHPFENTSDTYVVNSLANRPWPTPRQLVVHIHRCGTLVTMNAKAIIITSETPVVGQKFETDGFISISKYFTNYNNAITNNNYIPVPVIANSNFGYSDNRIGSLRFVPKSGAMSIELGLGSTCNGWPSVGGGTANGFYSLNVSWNIDYGS